MKSAIEVGLIIKEKRLEKKYTQLELSKKLLVSEKTISRWECGEGYPSMYIIDDICSLLEISLNDLLGDTKDLPNNGELIGLLQKKKNMSLMIRKVLLTIVMISLLILSFFPIDKNQDVTYSLFNKCFSSSFDWQMVIGLLLLISIIGNLMTFIYDTFFFVKSKWKVKNKKTIVFYGIFSSLGFVCSLLLELVKSSDIHIFGFVSFAIFFVCILIVCGFFITEHSLNINDREPLKKRYWVLSGIAFLVLTIGFYLSSLYLALVIAPFGTILVLRITTFFFSVLSPYFCLLFFLRIFKFKKSTLICASLIYFVVLLIFFVLYCLEISFFQYFIDVFTYIGIGLSPFIVFCFLNRINTYKKEEKLCLLI
jgi:transcriptional regulator with XRE-family HTH domain